MFKKIVVVMIAVLFVLTASSCAESTKGFPINPKETCLTIEDGARLRSLPRVPSKEDGDNTVFVVEMVDYKKFKSVPTTFRVETPQGLAEHSDNNGRWYGIRTADLRKALGDELAQKLPREENSLTWVNKDRAELCQK